MRFKPFHIVPSIINDFTPLQEDRVIAIMKSPTCDGCGDDTVADFTPIIFNESCDEWQCIDCWHDNNTETISDSMIEKIEETVDGIHQTNLIRNSWQYNNEIYHKSPEWLR